MGFSLGQFCLENWLLWRQYGVLRKTIRPKALEQEITQETFDKSQAYGRAKAQFSFVASLYNEIRSFAIIYYDVWPKAWTLTGIWLARYLPERFSGEISQSLLFLFLFSFIDTILELPLSYYHHFVLEEKFGFNKMSMKLWIMDKLKAQGLMIALGTPIGSAALWIIKKTGKSFFYYIWVFTLFVSIFFVTIYPIWIVPIFNKLTPLKPGELKDSIDALAHRLKFPLSELQVIDGSKRSSHSNAYFTGLPWKKKIVIFDTLLEQSTNKEIEAVLAHELGHWSKSHTTKLLAINQLNVFYLFALFSAFIDNKSLFDAFGFHNERPIIIGFMLFNQVQSPLESIIKLLMNIITRSFEYQAGEFFRLRNFSYPPLIHARQLCAATRLQPGTCGSTDQVADQEPLCYGC